MDRWKYFDITHREHVLCNPMSVEKFEELIALLRLEPGAQVLEIATGKGEFIIHCWRGLCNRTASMSAKRATNI